GEDLFAGQSPVVTLGVFDGVHRGHLAVIGETVRWARSSQAPALILTFDVHPRRFVGGGAPPAITSLEHRLRLFEQAGADATLILAFDSQLAGISAEDFARRWLHEALKIQGIVVGHDAHFGAGRSGNLSCLLRLGQQYGFAVRTVPPVMVEGEIVSSTAVRAAVSAGDLRKASAMLGRPVSVLGTVVAGKGEGRKLGFPTINLDLHHEIHPPPAVYIGEACCGNTRWPAAVNIAPPAAIQKESASAIEAHLLGFHGDLYGQVVEVFILERLREERNFASAAALRAQIAADVEAVRARFAATDRRGAR
ncbi:MAG: riboflavin biosynthesis protein RibF, partial [Planctomycetota bacterium]|nr:riboflavin biosynthesis protein RibF [Planctomycetota bacterium]